MDDADQGTAVHARSPAELRNRDRYALLPLD